MVPQRLAQLDRALASRGEDVTLRRNAGSAPLVTLVCRALVRGYEPHQLVGDIVQGDSDVVMSPSAILAVPSSVWPGAAGGDRMPKRGDYTITRGRLQIVQAADVRYEQGTPVRIELSVRG